MASNNNTELPEFSALTELDAIVSKKLRASLKQICYQLFLNKKRI